MKEEIIISEGSRNIPKTDIEKALNIFKQYNPSRLFITDYSVTAHFNNKKDSEKCFNEAKTAGSRIYGSTNPIWYRWEDLKRKY
mgnify:CR=1 FL=1